MGFIVSFLGQLPLGNMNFTATQVGIQESVRKAWAFAAGATIVEIIYLRFALGGMDWVVRHRAWFLALGWFTVILFLVLGVAAFAAAGSRHPDKKALLLKNKMNRFLLGMMMSALNPVQIPFWFLWTSTFIQANILPVAAAPFNFFTAGAGMGSLAGMAIYIHGGNWLVTRMNTSNKTLNRFMGVIFLVTAFIQLYRMLYRPWI